jgi:competence protein ComEC
MKGLKFFRNLFVLILVVIIGLLGFQYFNAEKIETSSHPFTVTFLDVGQGDAIVIQNENTVMLIDAGTNKTAVNLINELKSMAISRFDVIIATHPHEDHIGGMDNVINNFEVRQVIMPEESANTQTYQDVLKAINNKALTISVPKAGSSFNLGSAICTVLAPNSQNYEDTNNYSIVLRVVYGSVSFLLTGDAGTDSEKGILGKGYTLKSDVLKVGHHGSADSTSNPFLEAIAPRDAVILVGQDNDYGHPHKETLSKLNTAGIKIYRTDMNGTIVYTSNGTNLAVKTGK